MASLGLNLFSSKVIALATAGGILPAVFWLWFWLKEDKLRPEPRTLIAKTFLLGVLSVVPAYLAQRPFRGAFDPILGPGLWVIMVWAFIEEGLKYLAARFGGLKKPSFDEPVDAMVYLVTAALGFAAAENFLYILNAFFLRSGNSLDFLLVGNFRFIGATVVHIVSSALFGFFLAIAFCFGLRGKRLMLLLGMAAATLLHAAFNYFIISSEQNPTLEVFIVLWFAAILIIFSFERVKRLVCQTKVR